MKRPVVPLLVIVAGAVLAGLAPLVMPPFSVRLGQLVLFYGGLAVAWNILGGFAGYRSFGNTAFIGIGAFTAGLLQPYLQGLQPLAGFVAGLVAGIFACMVVSGLLAYPILRLRGAFFAIATLGVAHVCAELTNNIDAFQGAMGLTFPEIVPFDWEPRIFFYELYLAAAVITLLIAWFIKNSRFGYGLLAIREDEDTARMLGVPTERFKALALVISAGLTGGFGVIFANSLGYITTNSVYRDDTSLNLIVYCLLGGVGTLFGPVIGTILLVLLIQLVLGNLLDFHLFATGLLLVVLVLVAPDGVLGVIRKWRLKRRLAALEQA